MKAVRRLLGAILALVVLQYAAGALLFLTRPDTPVEDGLDAVVVLAGSVRRLPVARTLMDGGVAPVLVVSDDRGSQDDARAAFCDAPSHPYRVVCRRADPFSTRGEARMTAELAAQQGWRRIAVVTSRFHLFRTRILFERCTDAALVMRGAAEPWYTPITAIPLEWVKLAVAETTRRGC